MEIEISKNKIYYETAMAQMEERVNNIIRGRQKELIWVLEHDHIYTAGATTTNDEIKSATKARVLKANRGGKLTYHGPGQKILYIMINLLRNNNVPSVKRYVEHLELVVINALVKSGIKCNKSSLGVGVWIGTKKIASIGIRIRKWIAFHGIAINIDPDLSYFDDIKPCGLPKNSVSSICEIYKNVDKKQLEKNLLEEVKNLFLII